MATSKSVVTQLRKMGASELVNALATAAIPEDAGVARHEGLNILLPEDMGLDRAIALLNQVQVDQESPTKSYHEFNFAYNDVLVALDKAIQRIFGFTLQKATYSMFGMNPPSTEPVIVGLDENGRPITKHVPEGKMALPGLYDDRNDVGYINTIRPDRGSNPYIMSYMRKKHQAIAQQLMDLTNHYLRTESIYKGKVVNENLDFQWMGNYNPAALVLSKELRRSVEQFVMLPITNVELADSLGIEPRRSAILYGDYGTGKSMAMREIASRASAAGWTVILSSARGTARLGDLIRLARQYQPAVIGIEDVETQVGGSRTASMNTVLNEMDGALGKTDRVMVLMTTNNPSEIHEAVLRPGRTSVVLEFGALDGAGMARMFTQSGLNFDKAIGWDALAKEFEMLMPCYVKEAANRLGLTCHGKEVVDQDDVHHALGSLTAHFKLQKGAAKGNGHVTMDDIVAELTLASAKKAFEGS